MNHSTMHLGGTRVHLSLNIFAGSELLEDQRARRLTGYLGGCFSPHLDNPRLVSVTDRLVIGVFTHLCRVDIREFGFDIMKTFRDLAQKAENWEGF